MRTVNAHRTVRDFLEYFDIAEDEKAAEKFRACCDYWGITDADLHTAIQRAERYHRIALLSMRRVLGIYLREWMAPFDTGIVHRIYYNVPGTVTFMYFLKELAEQELPAPVYVGSPDFISMVVLYGLFGRKERIETGSCRHCAVNLMRAALVEDPCYPAADVQVSFGFTCDEAPKLDQMTEPARKDMLKVPVLNPVRSERAVGYIKKRMQEVLAGTQERFGLSSLRQSERDKLYRACKSQRFLLAVKVHQIIDHVRKCGKFRITNNDIVFLESLLITSFQCGTEHLIEVLTDLFEEIKSDTSKEAATVRHKMCVYYTPICNPEYGEIMEENGIALLDHTAFSNSALVTGSSDPCEDAALEAMGMLITGSAQEEGEKIAELIRRKKLDGFVSGMFAFDRWMGMQQHQLRAIIEERTGKTVFLYDTDFWNQESFSRDRMETAVETLSYIL